MTWVPSEVKEPIELLPVASERLDQLIAQLWKADVDIETLELCQARIARLLGHSNEPSPTPATDAQPAAIAFAEQYVIDPHGVTDEDAAELHRHFTPAQLATLTTALATFDAVTRTRIVLGA